MPPWPFFLLEKARQKGLAHEFRAPRVSPRDRVVERRLLPEKTGQGEEDFCCCLGKCAFVPSLQFFSSFRGFRKIRTRRKGQGKSEEGVALTSESSLTAIPRAVALFCASFVLESLVDFSM